MSGKLVVFVNKQQQLFQSVPKLIIYYLITVWIIQFLITWYVPANDIDSISSYLSRIWMEKLGSLERTATYDFLFTFPTFFDFLHKPFLEWGWFQVLPNFLMFWLLFLMLFNQANTVSERIIIFALFFSCQVLVVQATSGKNDMAIGFFAFLGWWAISRIRNNPIPYFLLALFAICALIGVKWTGLFFSALLFFRLMFISIKDKMISPTLLFLIVLLLPLYWYVSSVDSYLANKIRFGSFLPLPDTFPHHSKTISGYLQNVFYFFAINLAQTFDNILYVIDTYVLRPRAFNIFPAYNELLAGRLARYTSLPAADVSALGGFLAIVIFVMNTIFCFRNKEDKSLRFLSFLSVAYFVVGLAVFDFGGFTNRYFVAAYVLGIVPCAKLWARISKQRTVLFLIGYTIYMSFPALFMVREHSIFPVYDRDHHVLNRYDSMFETVMRVNQRPIGIRIPDRDALYFMIWSGALPDYDFYRKNIYPTDSLLIINFDEDSNSPVGIGPFIKNRSSTNTVLYNTRYQNAFNPRMLSDYLGRYDYVIALGGKENAGIGNEGVFQDNRYQIVYSRSPAIRIYKYQNSKV